MVRMNTTVIQSDSAITNFQGLHKFVRYNRENLFSKMSSEIEIPSLICYKREFTVTMIVITEFDFS